MSHKKDARLIRAKNVRVCLDGALSAAFQRDGPFVFSLLSGANRAQEKQF